MRREILKKVLLTLVLFACITNCLSVQPEAEAISKPIDSTDNASDREAYQSVIDLYSQAYEKNWNADQCSENDLAWIYGAYGWDAGYCFFDINADGITELLVGIPGMFKGDPMYGCFNALYTLVDGKPFLLLERGECESLFLCDDGTIGIYGFSGDLSETWDYYQLPHNGSTLLFQTRLGYDLELYPDETIGYKNNDSSSNHVSDQLMSRTEMMSLVSQYHYQCPFFTDLNTGEETSDYSSHSAFYGIWCLGTKDKKEAQDYAEWIIAQGYSAGVYLTTEWANLNQDPWYVVSAGEYQNENDAYAALDRIKQFCSDAYVKWTGQYLE